MSKKRRSWLINIGIIAAVFITSIFLMGAYDQSCDGSIKYAELHYNYDYSGLDTSINNSSDTVVNIEEGTAASIPIEVVITMQGNFTLLDVYGENGGSGPDCTTAAISYEPSSGSTPAGISFGATTRTFTSGTATTTGATITYTADLNLPDTVTAGDYEVLVSFKIHNIETNNTFTLTDWVFLNVYDLEITSSFLPDGFVGESYSETLSLRGGTPPFSWTATGLPTGLDIDADTGVISGIPTAVAFSTVTISVTDSSATPKTASADLDLYTFNDLSIMMDSLADGKVGDSYSDTLEADGGIEPYTWSAAGLPDGLSLNSSTGIISGTPTTAGTYDVAVTVTDVTSYQDSNITTITIGSAGGGGHSSKPDSKEPVVRGETIQIKDVKVDQDTGIAETNIKDNKTLDEAFDNASADDNGIKTIKVSIPKIDGAKGYQSTLPADFWASGKGDKAIEIKTAVADVKLPDNMLKKAELSGAEDISLTVSAGDKTKLDTETRIQIGDRPIIEIGLSIDGKKKAWNNDSAPVAISIPYKPTAEELKDPEHITVWYIDGSGKAVSVPSGRYDSKTGLVTFETTHFSKYAVAFVQKTFGDLNGYGWAKKDIEVLASKGIITGSSDSQFNPSAKITRADFLVLLTKTLGLKADADENFIDVDPGRYYYEAVGTAKELGIVTGLESNTFKPKDLISRQDMMVMAYRALDLVNPETGKPATENLDQYTDKDMVAGYARESVADLIKNGYISGSNGKINPRSNTTRAEVAVFLYNIYNAN